MISPSLKGASFAACFTFLSLPCQAMVDLDGDGMSDVWESHYGFSTVAGQASPPEQAPGADPDGDGYSNLRESLMVTDPNSALTGSGTLRPTIERQAGYQNLFTLTWPTRAEQFYYVVASTDLTPESWFYVTAELGDGNPVSLGIEALDQFGVPPDKLFWKIEVYNGDWDGDGLDNFEEQIIGSDLSWHDSDEDGMPDRWEYVYGLSPVDQTDGTGDEDEDGLVNILEHKLKLLPLIDDTDDDGILDGDEDSDNDGLSNIDECIIYETDPTHKDSDSDGLPDGWEIQHSFDPKSTAGEGETHGDADNDGLSNFEEYLNKTDPWDWDTDGDNISDLAERNSGSNPTNGTDGGQAPPRMVNVPFTVSDPSYSHSEKWELTITGLGPNDTRSFSLASPGYGEQASETFKLRMGEKYEIQIQHFGTDPQYLLGSDGQPDYDWEASVDGKPTSTSEAIGAESAGVNNYFSVGQGLWLVENREAVLTTEKHGDLEDIASGKKAYLTPVAIKDNRIASGVDDYSIQVGPNISGHKDKYWIMAPAGGEAFSNDTKFAILAQTPTPLKITCPGATPDSDRIWLDSSEHLVSWRGDGSTPSDKEPEFKAGDNEDDAPLAIGVKSMKRRMVSVAVHQIVSEQPNKPNMPPLLVPTQQHIENELNEAFGWQVNAYFNVTLLPPTNLQFNTATQTTWGYPFADSSAHPTTNNDFLDILTFDHAEIKTITNLRNTNYDINVFLVGGASPFITYGFVLNTSTLKADGTLAGLTNDDIECCVIDADRTWSGYNAWKKSVGGVLDTIAHEVGHVIVGPGHPSDDNGIANLPGTDRTVRLMASGDARVPNGNLLVKDEWDAAEEWLKNRPRGDN